VRDGDHWVINGAKTFISNGILCDLCIVVAKTDPDPKNAHRGISLFVVEAGTPGFIKGKKLEKMGMSSQDTSELAFEDCRVPDKNRLGEEGAGFMMLMQKLQQERLMVAIAAQANAEQVLADTLVYVKERKAFGKPIGSFQNTKFKLAECAAKVEVGRAFLDAYMDARVQRIYAGTNEIMRVIVAKQLGL
jgi:acyl-CoA dehydrogenase